jgi:hypothetical protein
MSGWASITNLIGPTGPTGPNIGPTGSVGQGSWTPYLGAHPELVTLGNLSGTFLSDGLTGAYYPVIRSFQRYISASMYLTLTNGVLTAGLSDNLNISYSSTNSPSEFSAAWIINYPTAIPVCDHGGLTGPSFNITGTESIGIVYDEAQINFIRNETVFWSVSDPNVIGRMFGKTLFLDVCCAGPTNIQNLVFSSSGSRGTLFFGSTGLPGVSAPASSRVGDFYIDYNTGILYIRST